MHDHHRLHVVDPEIILLFVTHAFDKTHGLFLGFGFTQFARRGLLVIVIEDPVGAFNQVSGLGHPVLQHDLLVEIKKNAGDHNDGDESSDDQNEQLLHDFKILQDHVVLRQRPSPKQSSWL